MKRSALLSALLLIVCSPVNAQPTAQAAATAEQAVEKQYSGFQSPVAIMAAGGALYVSDWSADTVTRITQDGSRSVIAQGVSAAAGLAADAQGRIYVASYSGNYIARIEADGKIVRIAENLATPTGLALARNGELLVANRAAGQVLGVNVANGKAHVLADGFKLPVGVVEMPDGSIVVSQYGGRVTRVWADGKKQEIGQGFARPGVGIAADGGDAVMVADNGAGIIRRIDFNGATTAVTPPLAGSMVALGKGIHGE